MRNRTLLDELGQHWPRLDATNMRILCEVARVPGISMGECAEELDLAISPLFANARAMAGGHRGHKGMGLLTIQKCSEDQRRSLMKPTRLGLKVAKILAPMTEEIGDEMKIKKDENQLDLLTGAA